MYPAGCEPVWFLPALHADRPVFELNLHGPANVEWYEYLRHLPVMCGEAVPQRMHAYCFLYPGFLQRFSDDVLNAALPHRLAASEAFK